MVMGDGLRVTVDDRNEIYKIISLSSSSTNKCDNSIGSIQCYVTIIKVVHLSKEKNRPKTENIVSVLTTPDTSEFQLINQS